MNRKPVLIDEGASDPHWWTHPVDGSTFIVYTLRNGDNLVEDDLTSQELLTSGTAGSTVMQLVRCYAELSGPASFYKVGDPVLLLNLPFKGGLSGDGAFVCTGYNKAYIAYLGR
jgi:hypothetical protein